MGKSKRFRRTFLLGTIIFIIAIIVFSVGYIYLHFFADNSENGEATDTEKEETKSADISERVSKAAFGLAFFLGIILFILFFVDKASRRKSSQF